jgi:hypothetical protein
MKSRFLTLTAALLGAAALSSNAAELVELRVNGYYFSEPATVRLTIMVEPNQANRTLRIEADGDRFYRATELNLEGLAEKRLHTVELKNLPAGWYEVRAEVLSASEVRGTATGELTVMGSGARDR